MHKPCLSRHLFRAVLRMAVGPTAQSRSCFGPDSTTSTGRWPKDSSGPITEAIGETWVALDRVLRLGKRGFPGGSSLANCWLRQKMRMPDRIPVKFKGRDSKHYRCHKAGFVRGTRTTSGTVEHLCGTRFLSGTIRKQLDILCRRDLSKGIVLTSRITIPRLSPSLRQTRSKV